MVAGRNNKGQFMAYKNRICSVDGCGKKISYGGKCKSHAQQKYHQANRELINLRHVEHREELKLDAMSYYSNGKPKCNICGFDDPRALVIDHINNNGAEHRKKIQSDRQGGGATTYLWLSKNKYPDGFQVLCANCNTIKERCHRRSLRA